MICARRMLGLIALAGFLTGCGGEAGTPANRPEEQKAADYGQKSLEKMKETYPVLAQPAKKGSR